MSHPFEDDWLDDQLRETPLPDGFLAALHGCLNITDNEIDKRLCAVPVPSGMLSRLYVIPHDVELDNAIGDVEVAESLLNKLREIAVVERPVRALPWKRFATASLLTAALSLSFIAFTVGWVAGSFPVVAKGAHEIVVLDPSWQISAHQPSRDAEFITSRLADQANELPSDRGHWMNEREMAPIALIHDPSPTELGPMNQLLALQSTERDLMSNVVILRWGILASGQRMEDDLPTIEHSDSLTTSGMHPPLARGYNRAFWLRHHVQPPMSTAIADLRVTAPPIVTSTQSFDRSERLVAIGNLPSPLEVRPEEFLAATVRYPAPSAGQIGLHSAAGPSRFGPAGTRLLQIGMQAGTPGYRPAEGTHLIVILDSSASMGRSGRWNAACRAIGRLPRMMSDKDRATLVVYTEADVMTLDELTAAQIAGVMPTLFGARTVGSFDLPAAIEHAAIVGLAREGLDSRQQRIAIVTDDDNPIPLALTDRLSALLTLLRDRGLPVSFLDTLATTEPQPHLGTLAEWAGGRALLGRDAQELTWSLAHSLYGHSATVATEATWQVEFNPKYVAAYRLIGHAGNALSGVIAGSSSADLRAADAATALFELWLQEPPPRSNSPGEKSDGAVAIVRLRWKDASSGEYATASQRVNLADFQATFGDCSPAFQMATIAAESAELLRGSRETLREIGAGPSRRVTPDDLVTEFRRVPGAPEMAEERMRLGHWLEQLKRLRSR